MAYRESLVQTRFRLRKDLLHKLEREAKRGDRAVNDEVARRLEASFGDEEEIQRLRKECERLTWEYERMAEERQRLVAASFRDLASHPYPIETITALQALEESAERHIQKEIFTDDLTRLGEYEHSDRDKNPAKHARKHPPAAAVGSPPARKSVKL
jgi:hypothetical protein